MPDPIVIDCGGQRFNLALMDTMLDAIRNSGSVKIINCAGGDMLELGMSLMAHYERIRDQK